MWLKNNSQNTWEGYDCGVCKIDILPDAVFEVSDGIGLVILKNLGSKNWITKTDAPVKATKKEVVEEEAPVEEKKKRVFKR